MRRALAVAMAALMLLSTMALLSVPSVRADAEVWEKTTTVTSPSGGETWLIGSEQTIEFDLNFPIYSNIQFVRYELILWDKETGVPFWITEEIMGNAIYHGAQDFTYPWTVPIVPQSFIEGAVEIEVKVYLLEYGYISDTDYTLIDRSDPFTIAQPPSLPTSFDWTNVDGKSYVTSVKDQNAPYAGGCAPHAATAALESCMLIGGLAQGDLDLSENAVSTYMGGGGDLGAIVEFFTNTGLPPQDMYQGDASTAVQGWQDYTYKIADEIKIDPVSVDEIKAFIYEHGPAYTVFRPPSDFGAYGTVKGIYSNANPAYDDDPNSPFLGSITHVVLIVGYNDDEQCFRCKNSWSKDWGEGGFFRISYSEFHNPISQFGMASSVATFIGPIAPQDPVIYKTTPSTSPLTICTQGAERSMHFEATLRDNQGVGSIELRLDSAIVDSSGYEWTPNDAQGTSGMFGWDPALASTEMSNSPHIIDLIVWDSDGNWAKHTWAVLVFHDEEKPTISSIDPDTRLKIATSGPSVAQTFSAALGDNVGVSRVKLSVDGMPVDPSPYVSTESGGPWAPTFYTAFSYPATLTVGSHAILLTVWDPAGNRATIVWVVTVYDTATMLNELKAQDASISAQIQTLGQTLGPQTPASEFDRIKLSIEINLIEQIKWAQSNGLLTEDQAQSLLAGAQAAYDSVTKAQNALNAGKTKTAANQLNTAINQLNALSNKLAEMLLTAETSSG